MTIRILCATSRCDLQAAQAGHDAQTIATLPHMCSPVAEAVRLLTERRAAMVAAGDLGAVRDALQAQEAKTE